jgi:hypothetical protein
MVADFEIGLSHTWEAAPVEQLGFKATIKRLGVGIVVAVAAPAHALLRRVSSCLKRMARY